MSHTILHRRAILLGLGASGASLLMPSAANAQSLGDILGGVTKKEGSSGGLGLSSILGKATDNALDDLAVPGAYFNDEDIRIGLPVLNKLGGSGGGGLLGTILGAGSKIAGLPGLDEIVRGINDGAGVAAGEAKPIFRDAIDGLSFSDAPGIIKENDGGTQYLKQSSSEALFAKLTPLVDTALGDIGVHGQIEKLSQQSSLVSQAGLDRDSVNKTVTDQGLDGIFKYVGKEEIAFRKNPLKGLGGIL
ncbi:MAG: DUF4197 domain-containing protein [Pseudomonadota bacterium]